MEKIKSYSNTQLEEYNPSFEQVSWINKEAEDYKLLKNKPTVAQLQVYSELHWVWTSDWTFTITAWFRPKIVKVSAYAVDIDERSSSVWTQIGLLTNTLISYFRPWTSWNSSTSTSDIIYLTLWWSTVAYSCSITWTGATFTITASWFSGWNAIIELYA